MVVLTEVEEADCDKKLNLQRLLGDRRRKSSRQQLASLAIRRVN
jgi:hypothetical protein